MRFGRWMVLSSLMIVTLAACGDGVERSERRHRRIQLETAGLDCHSSADERQRRSGHRSAQWCGALWGALRAA
ncbi:MAG: hypothetical protein WKF58_13815 [Ilumatobacteraceae bacterium]